MATDEDVSASWELSSHGPTTDNLQTDENHKKDTPTFEDENENRETKLQNLSSVQLRSPVLTAGRIPATAKSAFKPVSQRRQSLDSANLSRRDSFGVSNPRGAMTKELLTAQLRSFLVNDEPPTNHVVPGNDQETGKTLTTGTGRKLPPSPDVNQGDILPNQSGGKLGQVPRRPNSTDSRHMRHDRTSPMRSHIAKPPLGTHHNNITNNNNNNLTVNNNNNNNNNGNNNESNTSRVSPMQTTRRSRSNSRIPTPSSLNTSAVVTNSGTAAPANTGTANTSGNTLNQNAEGQQNMSNGQNGQTSGIPVLARRNSMGSYNGNSSGGGGTVPSFSRIPTMAKRPSPSMNSQPDHKTNQTKMDHQSQNASIMTKEATNTSFSRRFDDKEKPKSAFTSVKPQNSSNTRPKSSEPDEITTSSSINDPTAKRSSVIYIGESREPNTSRDDVTSKSFTSRIPVFQRTASARFESEQQPTHKCERAPRNRNKLLSESEIPNVSFSNDFTSSFVHKKPTRNDYVTNSPRRDSYATKKVENSDDVDYDEYPKEIRSPRKIPNLVNFETKHADVLSEAFSIIGKYYPEKQAYAYNFQRTGNLGPKLRSRLQNYDSHGLMSHNYFNRPLPVNPHLMPSFNNYSLGSNFVDPNLVYYNPRLSAYVKRPQTVLTQQVLQPTFVPFQQYGRPHLTYIPLRPYEFQ